MGNLFLKKEFEEIYHSTSNEFKQTISLDQFIELAAPFNEGVEKYHVAYRSSFFNLTHYTWIDDQEEKAIQASFDTHGEIQSLYLKPLITYPESDRQFTRNTYHMPINDEWFIFWGGTNELINYHYAYKNQRYAYDLVKVKEGLTYENTPIRNENYYAFDEEIVAPSDGKIVRVVDGLKDNVPGEMDAENPAGNSIIIEHDENEFSMLAHLKKNSVQVKVGDSVKAGQYIGSCGNSGNSTEPHLHFQVMDSFDFETGNSLRIRFSDGNEPIQGDTVSKTKINKQSTGDQFDKAETTWTIGEVLLLIPRAIAQFFK